MTGLEQAFYIMAIIFMSIMFVIMIALVAAVFVIKSKINHLHQQIEEKLDIVTRLAEKGGEISALAGSAVVKKAKNAIRKTKSKRK